MLFWDCPMNSENNTAIPCSLHEACSLSFEEHFMFEEFQQRFQESTENFWIEVSSAIASLQKYFYAILPQEAAVSIQIVSKCT